MDAPSPVGRSRPRPAWALDVVVAVWCVAWAWTGLTVAQDIRGLERLSDTVASVGVAAEQTGEALETLGGLPLVGERVPEAAAAVRDAGRSATDSAQAARRSVRRMSILLGLSISAVAIVPVLVAYLPRRIAMRQRRRRIELALRGGGDPALDAQLAMRAIASLPLDRLRAVTEDPLADLRAGRVRPLADAELAQLGIRRAPARAGD